MINIQAMGQSFELQQLILNLEKLNQLRSILTQLKKGYEILSQGYNTIKDLSQGNFNLHKQFLDKQLQVSPAVKNYKRAFDIVSLQIKLVQQCKDGLKARNRGNVFSLEELGYLSTVYADVIDRSRKNLEELLLVITANQLRMTDEQRIKAIDRIFESINDKTRYILDFNKRGSITQIQRKKRAEEIERLSNIYKK
jgi:regulator of sigma D